MLRILREETRVVVSREQVLDSIREIIRTDLKFSGIEIGEHLELVGGGLGLDSLDLLMLVTGIEKRFGHKIQHKKLNRDTMGTVGRFADFAFAELSAAAK
jgi:acyl carrier protein